VSTGGLGLYKYDGAWTRISPRDAEGLCGVGGDLYVDFGSIGLYTWDGILLERIATWDPEAMTGVGDTLYVDFGGVSTGGRGLYKYKADAWSRINTNDAEGMWPINLQ